MSALALSKMSALHSPSAADEKHNLARDSSSTNENELGINNSKEVLPLDAAAEKRLLRKIDYKVSSDEE